MISLNDLLSSLKTNKVFLTINTNTHEQSIDLKDENKEVFTNLCEKFRNMRNQPVVKKNNYNIENLLNKNNRIIIVVKILSDSSIFLYDDHDTLLKIVNDFKKEMMDTIISDEVIINNIMKIGKKQFKSKLVSSIIDNKINYNIDTMSLKYICMIFNIGILLIDQHIYEGHINNDKNILLNNKNYSIIKTSKDYILNKEEVHNFINDKRLKERPNMDLIKKMKVNEIKDICMNYNLQVGRKNDMILQLQNL